MTTPPLLAAQQLSCTFALRRRGSLRGPAPTIRAVSDVSLQLAAGESVGLVGESGCGKTSLTRLLLNLIAPSDGEIRFRGAGLRQLTGDALREYRRAVQPVFQDPYTALNPRLRVGRIVSEPLRASSTLAPGEIRRRVERALVRANLEPADADRYPHEFSGGQRQRIALARALSVEPELIILDEAVSSQDVSIRAQILRLLSDLRDWLGVGYLFISHDLNNVRYLCERVYVMYLGRIVEHGPTAEILRSPRHPYTQALLSAWLPPDPDSARQAFALSGEVASAADLPPGCSFHPRCPHATERCRSERPALRDAGTGQAVACHLHEQGVVI